MKGTIISITPDFQRIITDCTEAVTLEQLREAIGGGYIELIPFFNNIEGTDGLIIRCVAFCDEDGKLKKLRFNEIATSLWRNAIRRNGHQSNDVLCGPVAIVFGDKEFMEAF